MQTAELVEGRWLRGRTRRVGAIIANTLIKLEDGPRVEIVRTDETWTVRDVLDR